MQLISRAATLVSVLSLLVIGYGQPMAAPPDTGLTGRLLVATESIRDPRFQETVIYLVSHNAEGAFGIIVNQPLSRLPLAEFLSEMDFEADGAAMERVIALYYGGPVQPELGFVLHTNDYAATGTTEVANGISLTTDREIFDAIASGQGPRRWLFALGYAGWGPGQLEAEMARDSWIVAAADQTLVFAPGSTEKWRAALDRRLIDL